MIVLRSEPLTNDYSVREIAEFDTKAAILESFAILHLGVAKSYRKGELAWLLDHMFNENPSLFANILPEKEQIPYDTKLPCHDRALPRMFMQGDQGPLIWLKLVVQEIVFIPNDRYSKIFLSIPTGNNSQS